MPNSVIQRSSVHPYLYDPLPLEMSKLGDTEIFMRCCAGHENEEHSVKGEYEGNSSALTFVLECMDGREVRVAYQEAMMSPTLWMFMQTIEKEIAGDALHEHRVPMLDVPSHSVELALYYCRCLYQAQIEGHDAALHLWKQEFFGLDSKTLCDLAKIASQLDIQPLIDDTCSAIAQIMSTTGAADEIREKFALGELPADADQLFGLDVIARDSEIEQSDQPSIEELLEFINGKTGSHQNVEFSPSSESLSTTVESMVVKKKKKKKKNRTKKSTVESVDVSSFACNSDVNKAVNHAENVANKMELARQDPNAIFEESKFEDEEDEEVAKQIELFRQSLESAHLEIKQCIHTDKPKPRLHFAPGKIFSKH
uniref:Uncharacterized protein AlNc14C108G6286 n=1 Tax=Albugo laibachii Nc14 TaxID=890382 RepID=F0WI79_9STRA|nr:conserved hypothetical protein [Albugo laibachii Nc14]|eukprot:CCA20958.1 conserved hypothetical protein [Albugo laibachii Nc14]